ncbi:hypothetical protein [Paracoccus sp. (in: a-proteobacteria)]|uniref:hypothetical protein n=1 Tax=Paracoccus sp. TaxID=267 RepID=UPI00289EA1CA|nr:hypothetical protein [Paracoccus sp. (in: a-proteobacteria)]
MTPTPTAAARVIGTISKQLRIAGWHDAADYVAGEWMQSRILAAIQPDPEPKHPDEEAVDRFAAAMKTKLRKKRAEGRSGWDGPECDANVLTRLLREHVEKGDPLDVGNLSMMLHQRGERIQTDPKPQTVAWAGPGEKPHAYSPDLIAGGDDCRHCGHGWDMHQPATPSSAGTVSVEAAARTEVRQLREALRPFAEYMQTDEGRLDLDYLGNEIPDDQGVGWVYLTHGDFRAALRALAGER